MSVELLSSEMNCKTWIIASVMPLLFAGSVMAADVDVYYDAAEWAAAIDHEYHFTDFTNHELGEWLDDQYADWGIDFLAPAQVFQSPPIFFDDEWGIKGFGTIFIDVTEPIYAAAVDMPDVSAMGVSFHLVDGELETVSETGFVGIVSDTPIDFFGVSTFGGGTGYVDDLYVGHIQVPAPGALATLPLLLFAGRRRTC